MTEDPRELAQPVSMALNVSPHVVGIAFRNGRGTVLLEQGRMTGDDVVTFKAPVGGPNSQGVPEVEVALRRSAVALTP